MANQNPHSLVAYPFTKSDRDRDKIMSEVQLSRLHLALVNNTENVIISRFENSTVPKEVLIHGYYFRLDYSFASEARGFYIYLERDMYQSDTPGGGYEIPELLQVIPGRYSSSGFADHECIFKSPLTTASNMNSIGVTQTEDGLVDSSGNPVDIFGGKFDPENEENSDFVDIANLFTVYYFGENFDDRKKGQIWVRTRNIGNNQVDVLNPYVYCSNIADGQFGFGKWAPLGAVYKSFETT